MLYFSCGGSVFCGLLLLACRSGLHFMFVQSTSFCWGPLILPALLTFEYLNGTTPGLDV
jgi:hypothetical protein